MEPSGSGDATPEREAAMDGKTRVLVIDDDEDFRASVTTLLTSAGYDVAEAASGRDGLEQLAAVHPDLVVLDVMMENASEGYGVNQAIKFQPRFQEFQNLPVVMVSSIEESPDERFSRASEVGMIRPDRYLTKPLDVPRFLATVRRLAPPA
jgi:CheY-like chemotaxis protein